MSPIHPLITIAKHGGGMVKLDHHWRHQVYKETTDFWSEAASMVVFILNRTLTRSMEGRTPYEGWFNSMFVCRAYTKETWLRLKNLDDRSRSMVMIGYEPGGNACHLYDPANRPLHVSHDDETVLVQFIGTKDQLANILNKALEHV
jgi:hypothetical protein